MRRITLTLGLVPLVLLAAHAAQQRPDQQPADADTLVRVVYEPNRILVETRHVATGIGVRTCVDDPAAVKAFQEAIGNTLMKAPEAGGFPVTTATPLERAPLPAPVDCGEGQD